MSEMERIDRLAATLAEIHGELAAAVRAEDREIAAVRARHARQLGSLARAFRRAFDALHDAVDANRSLFRRPKTFILHDIRLGLMKGKGRIAWDDEEKVIARLKILLPERLDDLIQTTEALRKSALAALDARTLKRLGVSVVESGDEVVVKPAPSAVEKRIAALLAGED